MNGIFALVTMATAWATSIDQVPNPRDQNGWVSDVAGVLDAAAEARIEDRIDALHSDLDVEIAVVTLQDVEGTPKQFATGLFNHWGIGDREANNGLLVLLVMGERRLEMETGYGLEPVLPDGWLGTMQQRSMVPAFKRGDFGGGLEAGLEAVDGKLRGSPEESRHGTRAVIEVGGTELDVQTGAVVAAGSGTAGGVLAIGGILWLRRRRRTCEKCDVYMPMLSEVDDDEHLDSGQRSEEQLGSVDYQVHQCPECGDTRTFEKVAWFSGYDQCPSCRVRARTTSTTTLVHATTVSGGLVEVTENCSHCNHHNTYTRATARLPQPSSSSSSGGYSSGGGSFGGGSSGGGGAGSSW